MTAVLGADLVVWLAFALLAGGVVGSIVPVLPGGLLSLGGVYLFWWHTGYASPGPVVLVGLTLVGLVAVVADWLSGVVAAKAGGASTWSSVVGAGVGVLLFVTTGPVGLVTGIAATVFLLEYRRQADARAGLVAALAATLGVLASSVVQAVLTFSMLLAMVAVVLL
ncbi:DUF456 domain-containing protein [Halobacteriales archaeon Cl-PHB]